MTRSPALHRSYSDKSFRDRSTKIYVACIETSPFRLYSQRRNQFHLTQRTSENGAFYSRTLSTDWPNSPSVAKREKFLRRLFSREMKIRNDFDVSISISKRVNSSSTYWRFAIIAINTFVRVKIFSSTDLNQRCISRARRWRWKRQFPLSCPD